MSPYKIAGCCSLCDAPAFEVKAVWDEGEKRAGEPKQLGAANSGTTRVTFLLLDGRRTDMTFCGDCAASLTPEAYPTLWRKNLAGWLREQDGNPAKFLPEFGLTKPALEKCLIVINTPTFLESFIPINIS
mgnify:CR=1 FL=1